MRLTQSSARVLLFAVVLVSLLWLATLAFLIGNCAVGDATASAAGTPPVRSGAYEVRRRAAARGAVASQPSSGIRLYLITPTYARLVQRAELTRLSHAFCLAAMHGFDVHWIVVEDAVARSAAVASLLAESCRLPDGSGVAGGGGSFRYTHLHEPTPDAAKLRPKDPSWLLPRGVLQRNAGLRWLRANCPDDNRDNAGGDVPSPSPPRAIVYFADDDNTYDIRLFYEMQHTQKVSVWPVGAVGYLKYEAPIVRNGKVIAWYTYWYRERRKFAMDMAGFAVHLSLILSHPEAAFSLDVDRGFQESTFLDRLGVTLSDLEPRADNCTKVYVWHTRSETPSLKNEQKMLIKYNETYPVADVLV